MQGGRKNVLLRRKEVATPERADRFLVFRFSKIVHCAHKRKYLCAFNALFGMPGRVAAEDDPGRARLTQPACGMQPNAGAERGLATIDGVLAEKDHFSGCARDDLYRHVIQL